jgi:hypothetical protein
MRKEFEALHDVLFNGNTYDNEGNCNYNEVNNLLTALENKIIEVEKRMDAATRSAKEITDTISIYQDSVDNGSPFTMNVSHYDNIRNSSDDVRIALDLNDDMAVIDNWYNLFSPIASENNFHVEDEETYPIVNCLDCGYPQPLLEENVHVDSMGRHMVCESCEGSFNVGGDVFMTFESSWGEIDCDREGNVLEIRGDEYIGDERSYLYDIAKFDLVEYGKFCESLNITMGEADDILFIGFWKKSGEYNEADKGRRDGLNIFGDEIAPTMQCTNTHTFDKVKEVIQILKTLDNGDCVDGETMEYILKQVGMQDQMLKQLFPLVSNDELDELLDIRNEYNSAMMSKGKV